MAVTTISKISNVIFIKDSANTNAKSYFGATGSFQGNDSNTTVILRIGSTGQVQKDEYVLTLGSVTVGGSTPSTMSSLLVLLNSIFGT